MPSNSAAVPYELKLTLPAAFNKPPFLCSNEGWGEFEIIVDCYITEKQKQSFPHDLHFGAESYDEVHTVGFKNPSQALQQILRETGPLPTDEKKRPGAGKKPSQKYDFEQIAAALQQLDEDDLLRVIQIINDNRTPEMYIKSDVEGECRIQTTESRRGHAFDAPCVSPPLVRLWNALLFALLKGASVLLFYSPLLNVDRWFGSSSTLIANDLCAAGEFSIDLYTMPDSLTKTLWDYLVSSRAPFS
jgi:hypothetical protein